MLFCLFFVLMKKKKSVYDSLSPSIPLLKPNESSSACKYQSTTARTMGMMRSAAGGWVHFMGVWRHLVVNVCNWDTSHQSAALRPHDTIHSSEQKGIHGISVTLDSSLQMWHMTANTDNNPRCHFVTQLLCSLFTNTCKHFRPAKMAAWCNGNYECSGMCCLTRNRGQSNTAVVAACPCVFPYRHNTDNIDCGFILPLSLSVCLWQHDVVI